MLENKNDNSSESDYSVYNEKELEYLDKYLPIVKNAFDVKIKYLKIYFFF